MKEISRDWCKSEIVSGQQNGDRSCENHRETSLIGIASKMLSGIIYWLPSTREKCVRVIKAAFPPARGCIDQIFNLRQILDHRHTRWTDDFCPFLF